MKKIIFDIETNGLLDSLSVVHCICLTDIETGEIQKFSKFHRPIQEALEILKYAEQIIGFNNVSFDNDAIEKVYGDQGYSKRLSWTENLDLMLFAQLKHPDTKGRDFGLMASGFPGNLVGRHSLEAWGYRLGVLKGDYGKTSDWSECTEEMVEYCAQDVAVTLALYKYLDPESYSSEAIQLEHDIRRFINIQEAHGAPFDTQKARELYKQVKADYDQKWETVKDLFPDKVEETVFVPKVNSTKFGYQKGVPKTKTIITAFNPGSRQQLIDFFKSKYNWEPVAFTEKGNPEIGYEVLEKLEFPEAKILAELFDMKKLMGTLYDGDNGWLKMVKDNRIHGRVITNGCVSGRASHYKPNLGNVPNETAYKGRECRELFASLDPAYDIVGGDAAAIQVRLLAHYLHFWDEGEYAHEAVNGDIHTKNMNAFGLTHRGTAKTVFFAMIFGAGASKLGRTVEPTSSKERAEAIGKEIINNFKKNIPAYDHLSRTVKNKLYQSGYLSGLDGRKLIPRSKHAGLCTLIQGAEAVVMKKALTLIHKAIIEEKLDATPIIFVHDEAELLVHKSNSQRVAQLIPEKIKEAGVHFKLKVPMDGTGKIGNNWYDVH